MTVTIDMAGYVTWRIFQYFTFTPHRVFCFTMTLFLLWIIAVTLRSVQTSLDNVSVPADTLIDTVSCHRTVNEAMATDSPWWRTGVIYQVYPRSFQDSTGDGVGDLRGIEACLDYIKSLGITAIWLSPIYQSPMRDFGYDVSDYREIDPLFGTMADFDSLLNAIHEKGLYLIMDFVPNHTSDLHQWFKESSKGKDNPYSDYYVWHDGKTLENGTRAPPNNWISKFGGSPWEWSEERQQYYYHQYAKEQPDLNYRHDKLRQEMEDVLLFWLQKGVDGFRLDAVDSLVENGEFLDEPRSYKEGVPDTDPHYLSHVYTRQQPETFSVVRSWRKLFDEFEKKTGKYIYMVAECEDGTPDLSVWKRYVDAGADQSTNFFLLHALTAPRIPGPSHGTNYGLSIREAVNKVLGNTPLGRWPTWVTGSHDFGRIASRAGPENADAINMLLLLLPGTPTTYYGEELGMTDITVTKEQVVDPAGLVKGGLEGDVTKYSRDPCRSPMQWNNDVNAGFSIAAKTWLPVHPAYIEKNIELQDSDAHSTLNKYRQLVHLRNTPAFLHLSEFAEVAANRDLYAFVRYAKNTPLLKYLVILNLASSPMGLDCTAGQCEVDNMPETGRVVFNTVDDSAEQTIMWRKLILKPSQGMVLELS